ncbi:hypothetical protein STIUS_v1c01890 [Spiroplasma sp. TIUS-1]|uniref:sulfite exporter TauE/SafE family protein n=1 Tax=Spiroplasma sp. TIUS-1 TaxID=216963 RepID=UPI0013986C0F|nr:sulfite exporter TauE/SafE family protein [Spiroplasma sp. TIUS-1]QHX35744.1 hypothetical protein STIUS_v1c01890 [Spiroplasma sp. TIUS-1]
MSLFILIPILFFGAILISSLGSISGVGGGVLFVPLLTMLLSNEGSDIKFISTVLVFVGSLFNVIFGLIRKEISFLVIGISLVFSIPFVLLGNYLSDLISETISQIIVIIFLIIVTILLILSEYVFKHKDNNIVVSSNWYTIRTKDSSINLFKLITIIILGSLITAITGMGGGPILMPLLLLWVGLSMKGSAPISHIIIACTSLVNIIINYSMFQNTEIMINYILPMTIGVIIGSVIVVFVKKYIKNEIIIKWILISLIWISVLKMIIDLF